MGWQVLEWAMETLTFGFWQEFRDYVDQSRVTEPVYWRGHADANWPLASSFERKILSMAGGDSPGASRVYPYDMRYQRDGRPTWEEGFYQAFRDAYLSEFKEAAIGLRGPSPRDLTVEEWWSLGRHYGLTTPLLDWTEKPYHAAFFALTGLWSGMKKLGGVTFEGKEAAVYRLIHNRRLEGNGLRVVKPVVEELGRLHAQRGVFTWLESEYFFELQGFLDNTGRGDLLTCIRLSDQVVMAAIRDFDAHGIDYRLLFPDLAGAALNANTSFDVPL